MSVRVNALVITGFGINCEEEMAAAWRLAGATARIVHLNEVLSGAVDIHAFQVLSLPGGFSFGDDLGSGKVLANKIRFAPLPSGRTLLQEIRGFLDAGGFIIGICNGFQALVKMGLLPDVGGEQKQEVTLTTNKSGIFEDRWVHCKVRPGTHTPFLKGLDVIALPVRHGEGRLLLRDPVLRAYVIDGGLNCMSYCTPTGNPTSEYPANPNGADLDCAALTDTTGQVLGMMPHPEAFLSLYNHPDWPALRRRDREIDEAGTGLIIFRNLVEHLQGTGAQA
jgi:phosphoribosylformylglycinamidine (FGAM) synthase-like amidotransferase family enzyme